MFRMFPLFRLLRVYTGHPTSRSPKSGKRAIYAGLNVDFKAVCDAVLGAWQGNGETITDVAARFRVSRGWIYKHVYPALDGEGESDRES